MTTQASQSSDMPELPAEHYEGLHIWTYSADQMRDYARKAIAAQTAQAVPDAECNAECIRTNLPATKSPDGLPDLKPPLRFVHGYSQTDMWEYGKQAAENKKNLPFEIYLIDRADGVKGHYAIGRMHPEGYQEVWNVRSHRWASVADDALTLEQASKFLMNISVPTKSAAPPQAIAAVTDEQAARLWKALQTVRNDLERANNDGKIADTIWHTDHETLFDFIDTELEGLADLTHHAAPAQGEKQHG